MYSRFFLAPHFADGGVLRFSFNKIATFICTAPARSFSYFINMEPVALSMDSNGGKQIPAGVIDSAVYVNAMLASFIIMTEGN